MLNRQQHVVALLRSANPVTRSEAALRVADFQLQRRVLARRAELEAMDTEGASVVRSRRRVRVAGVGALAAAAVAVLFATPALARLRDALTFWDAPAAPATITVQFSEMNTGAPAGMSPGAVAAETRRIGDFDFGGRTHTLWVAPTQAGGFCFEWIGGWGGCTSASPDPLSWSGDLIVPSDVPLADIPAGASPSEITAIGAARHHLAVATWLSGYITAGTTTSVRIRFSDGSTVSPEVTWVSQPIDAGFFAYDVPPNLRLHTDHVTTVEALDSTGAVVASQVAR